MKTRSVRITKEQAERLEEVIGYLPGKNSINGLVQHSVNLFLELEASVYETAFKDLQEKMKSKATGCHLVTT